jgi:hypothetical protein
MRLLMILSRLRLPALVCALFLTAPFGAAAWAATGDDPAKPAETEQKDIPAEQGTANGAPGEAEADKVTCRYVKLDTASRRKTKVCRTVEGWRELNNPR